MKKELPKNIINPFSDNFLQHWDLWKQFKKEVFQFMYKGVMSEQQALINLNTISAGDEQTAIDMIKQSIGEQWAGLHPLKEKYKTNGQKRSEQSSVRSEVNAEFNRRYNNR